MKPNDETSFRNRRLILSALIVSPVLLPSYVHAMASRSPAKATSDPGDFVIVNGWVLLKQDIAEHEEAVQARF